MVLRKLDSHMYKNELDPYLTPYIKITSKWINDWNIIPETIKFAENIRGKLFDIGLSDLGGAGFTLKAKATKNKTKLVGLHQTKKLLYRK